MNPNTTDLDSESLSQMEKIWEDSPDVANNLQEALTQDAQSSEQPETPAEPVIEEARPSDEILDVPAPVSEDEPASEVSSPLESNTDLVDDLFPEGEMEEPVAESPISQEASVETREIEDPEELNPKQQHAWGELKHRAKEAERELAEAREKLSQVEGGSAEVKHLKSELLAAEERLGQLDLTRTRAFQERYNRPLQIQIAKAAKLMAREGADENESKVLTVQLARASYEDRKAILAERFPEAMGALVNIFEEVESLDAARTDAVRQWKDTQNALKASIDSDQQAAVNQRLEQTATKTLQKLQSGKDVMFNKRDGSPDWNKSVDDRLSLFKGTLKAGNPDDLAYFIAKGIASADMEKILRSEIQKRRALAAELKAIRGSAPNVSASRTGVTVSSSDSPSTNEELITKIWQ